MSFPSPFNEDEESVPLTGRLSLHHLANSAALAIWLRTKTACHRHPTWSPMASSARVVFEVVGWSGGGGDAFISIKANIKRDSVQTLRKVPYVYAISRKEPLLHQASGHKG